MSAAMDRDAGEDDAGDNDAGNSNTGRRVAGSRVGVVGGSIGGCAASIALERLGCDVTVFERHSGALQDRGSGIAIPLALRDELIDAGYLRADYPACISARRHWYLADGSDDSRQLWDQPSEAAMSNWGVLWRSLRAGVADDRYRDGTIVTAVRSDADGAVIDFDGAASERFDIVVAADGYRSSIRSSIAPDLIPSYAGYVLWRGNFPEARLSDRTLIDRLDADGAWLTVTFDGGHGVMYPIPDFDDGTQPGERRVNWAVYAPQPAALDLDLDLDLTEPMSIPPGQVSAECYAEIRALIDRRFPALSRPLFDSPRDEVSIQPIYDQSVDSYVHDKVVLFGDAGTLARPHTGSGATKAIQDARALELLGAEHGTWDDLLEAFDHDRSESGRSLVELGRRIGRDQVECTPPWSTMTSDDFERWTAATLAGEQLYFWGDDAEPTG